MSKKLSASFVDRVISPRGIKWIAVLLLVIIVLSLGRYRYVRKPALILPPTPTPQAIPHGKIEFTVVQSDSTVPQFGKGLIDPYDPAQGATQTVTITAKHSQPVTKVTAVLKTDHAVSTPVPFTLTSGTNTNGQWQGSWQITDTYLYTYNLVLQAESSNDSASVEITLR